MSEGRNGKKMQNLHTVAVDGSARYSVFLESLGYGVIQLGYSLSQEV